MEFEAGDILCYKPDKIQSNLYSKENFQVEFIEYDKDNKHFSAKVIFSTKKEWIGRMYHLIIGNYELYESEYKGADNLIELLTKLEDKFKT